MAIILELYSVCQTFLVSTILSAVPSYDKNEKIKLRTRKIFVIQTINTSITNDGKKNTFLTDQLFQ